MNETRIQWLLGMIDSITNIQVNDQELLDNERSSDLLMNGLKQHLLIELNKTFIEGKKNA
jgi:hypothetical protein